MPFEASGAYLGALQILQNADGAVLLFRGAAQAGNIARVLLMGAVGEVQPGYIHAQPHQLTEHGFGIARRANGADDLGAAGGRDGKFSGEFSGNKIQLTRFQIECRRERPARASPIPNAESLPFASAKVVPNPDVIHFLSVCVSTIPRWRSVLNWSPEPLQKRRSRLRDTNQEP
jgi:hypothetical protein